MGRLEGHSRTLRDSVAQSVGHMAKAREEDEEEEKEERKRRGGGGPEEEEGR